MNLFENRFYSLGFIMILISGGITVFTESNETLQIIAAVLAVAGLAIMFYGMRQYNKKQNK